MYNNVYNMQFIKINKKKYLFEIEVENNLIL